MDTEQKVQQPQTAVPQPAETQAPQPEAPQKFCKHCGGKIPADAVVCTLCGRQVEEMGGAAAPSIVINNSNENTNTNINTMNAYMQAKAGTSGWLCCCAFSWGALAPISFMRARSAWESCIY